MIPFPCSRNRRSKQDKGSGTLDGWLTAGGGKGGAAAGLRDMPPLLLPRVPLPPLVLPSEDGQTSRPAKKRKGLTAADRDVEAVMLRMLKQVRLSLLAGFRYILTPFSEYHWQQCDLLDSLHQQQQRLAARA